MKCPVDNIEMLKIAETVNGNEGTYVYWLCNGSERRPRKHIVKTVDWINVTTFYLPTWTSIKTVNSKEASECRA